MKKLTMLLALGATAALMPSVSKASIIGSAHDFYSSSTTNLWQAGYAPTAGRYGANVCGECHDVHKAPASAYSGGPSRGPLWVHAPSSQTYVTYEQAGSDTFNALGLTVSLGESKACLSCHDGTVGINQKLALSIDGTLNATPSYLGNTNQGPILLAGKANACLAISGNDLTHVHPIGINYNDAASKANTLFGVTEFQPSSATFKGSTLTIKAQLKGTGNTQMECSTCHDIHNTRTLPHGQDLCTSCHIK